MNLGSSGGAIVDATGVSASANGILAREGGREFHKSRRWLLDVFSIT